MVIWLLHNPWVQFYLLLVGALGVTFLWDYRRRSQGIPEVGSLRTSRPATGPHLLAAAHWNPARCRIRNDERIGK
jgi:hypothetical protein